MQVNDEVPHHRVIDRTLCRAFPRRVRRLIIRIDPDDIEVCEVVEFMSIEVREFTAKYEVKQLRLGCGRGVFGHNRKIRPEGMA